MSQMNLIFSEVYHIFSGVFVILFGFFFLFLFFCVCFVYKPTSTYRQKQNSLCLLGIKLFLVWGKSCQELYRQHFTGPEVSNLLLAGKQGPMPPICQPLTKRSYQIVQITLGYLTLSVLPTNIHTNIQNTNMNNSGIINKIY